MSHLKKQPCILLLPFFLLVFLPNIVSGGEQKKAFNLNKFLTKIPNKGICVLLGETDISFPIQLARQSELFVYVQLSQDKLVQAARVAAGKAGLLGSRVYIAKGDPQQIYLATDLADFALLKG